MIAKFITLQNHLKKCWTKTRMICFFFFKIFFFLIFSKSIFRSHFFLFCQRSCNVGIFVQPTVGRCYQSGRTPTLSRLFIAWPSVEDALPTLWRSFFSTWEVTKSRKKQLTKNKVRFKFLNNKKCT